jgi:hypothetical protein
MSKVSKKASPLTISPPPTTSSLSTIEVELSEVITTVSEVIAGLEPTVPDQVRALFEHLRALIRTSSNLIQCCSEIYPEINSPASGAVSVPRQGITSEQHTYLKLRTGLMDVARAITDTATIEYQAGRLGDCKIKQQLIDLLIKLANTAGMLIEMARSLEHVQPPSPLAEAGASLHQIHISDANKSDHVESIPKINKKPMKPAAIDVTKDVKGHRLESPTPKRHPLILQGSPMSPASSLTSPSTPRIVSPRVGSPRTSPTTSIYSVPSLLSSPAPSSTPTTSLPRSPAPTTSKPQEYLQEAQRLARLISESKPTSDVEFGNIWTLSTLAQFSSSMDNFARVCYKRHEDQSLLFCLKVLLYRQNDESRHQAASHIQATYLDKQTGSKLQCSPAVLFDIDCDLEKGVTEATFDDAYTEVWIRMVDRVVKTFASSPYGDHHLKLALKQIAVQTKLAVPSLEYLRQNPTAVLGMTLKRSEVADLPTRHVVYLLQVIQAKDLWNPSCQESLLKRRYPDFLELSAAMYKFYPDMRKQLPQMKKEFSLVQRKNGLDSKNRADDVGKFVAEVSRLPPAILNSLIVQKFVEPDEQGCETK